MASDLQRDLCVRHTNARAMQILVLSMDAVMRWSRPARMAYHSAVLHDPEPFCAPGPVFVGAVLIEAHRFLARWERGLPWPPPLTEEPAAAEARAVSPHAVPLAGMAAAVGVKLARVLFLDEHRRRRTN